MGLGQTLRFASITTLAAAAVSVPAAIGAAPATAGGSGLPVSVGGSSSSGGASVGGGGLAPTGKPKAKVSLPPSRHARGQWLSAVTITEYWPAPESWFTGRLVEAPGLPGRHRIDWLYSATGVSMQGDGIGLDGQPYHISSVGIGGWVTEGGASTTPSDGWLGGAPFWRAGGYWSNRRRGVTFPLAAGGWSAGRGRKYVPLGGVSFALGRSLPLRYYQSIAVDPSVIPLGSRVFVPAYQADGYGGWFIAQDTGGAINGRHVDVYRPPPPSAGDSGQSLTSQRIYVIRPKG